MCTGPTTALPRANMLPCPTCSGTTWATAEDRHARTAKDVCPTCRHTPGWVDANTGTSPETSAPADPSATHNTSRMAPRRHKRVIP